LAQIGNKFNFAIAAGIPIGEYERLALRVPMAPTRVLLYVPLLELGGTERKVERLACGLDRKHFEPVVAWSDRWGPVADGLKSAGIQVCHLHPRSEDAWAQEIRRIGPDIFHSFSYRKDATDVLAANAAGVPVIVTTRVNGRAWDPELRVREWETIRNRLTHRITAVSKAAADLCARVEGIPRQEITVIHNGVPIPARRQNSAALRLELGLPDSVQLIGCVGSYRPEKGHALLLRAFRRVLDQHPQSYLVCCGGDPFHLKAGVQELASELGLDRNIRLLDVRADVDTMYGGFDVYVQPSLSEGFSNAILEAMMYRLPVVATSVGGNTEAVADGLTGSLVPPDDAVALGDAVSALLSQPDRARILGEAGEQRARRLFSLATMVEAHQHLYEELRPRRAQLPPRRNDGRVRVLFHVDYLWSGGLEKKVENLVLGLDRTRFDPIVSWSRKWGPVGRRIAEAGVPVAQINVQHSTAAQRIREVAPDIFHSFSCSRNSADVRAAQAAGVGVIITNRGSMRFWEEGETLQSWELERNCATQRIVACSQAVAGISASIEKIPPAKIAVVHNGVAIPGPSRSSRRLRQELNVPDSVCLIGYPATYRAIKGHEFLLRAFRQVVDRQPGTHLVCFGEEYDDTRLQLRALAAELCLTSQVSFLDAREDVEDIYSELDVYAHPSLSEGFSNSILEAMAHALPVVATAVGGTPEAVADGITGLLVPPADSAAFAAALLTLLGDPELRKTLGRAGLERVKQRFSIARMVAGYQNVYEEALIENRESAPAPATGSRK
jgi:L-malate glycosyltransferase